MILMEAGKSTVIVGPPGAYLSAIALDIAAAAGAARLAFDLVPLPSNGPTVWLADMRYRVSDVRDRLDYWRGRRNLPAAKVSPALPLYLPPNADPAKIVATEAAETPGAIVRDFVPSGLEYDAGMPSVIGHWLDTTAPALAKQFGAAILTTITSRLGLQDLAGHADVVLAVEIVHSVGLRLHQVKPASATRLTLQVHADRHGCLVVGFREETLIRGADGEPEILARRSAA